MINITNQNKEDLIASCLIEAANVLSVMDNTGNDVLEESASSNQRKQIISDSKKFKKSFDYKYFISGKLDRQDAQNEYKKIIASLNDLQKRVDQMPQEETNMQKYLNKHSPEWADIITKKYLSNTGETDWNKARAKKVIQKLRDEIIFTYKKYYESGAPTRVVIVNKTNNEKVKEAMGESVESHLGFADTLLSVIDD